MDVVAHALPFLQSSQYALLFFSSVLEGTVAMLVGGYLVHQGLTHIVPTYAALLLGNIVIDFVWYMLGFWGGRKFVLRYGHIFNVNENTLARAEALFHTHHTWILVVTKLTGGFGLAVAILTTAGMLRVPLSRYMFINLISGLLWIAMVMAVGYEFGNILEHIPATAQIAFLLAVLLAFIFGARWANKKIAEGVW